MDRARLLSVGDLVWVRDDNGALKLITIDAIEWNSDPDLRGYDIVSAGEYYWIEYCYFLEFPIGEN